MCSLKFTATEHLFHVYIKEHGTILSRLQMILFDVFMKGKTLKDIENNMNAEVKHIVNWLQANRLSLNGSKTHYIIFALSNRSTIEDLKISLAMYR